MLCVVQYKQHGPNAKRRCGSGSGIALGAGGRSQHARYGRCQQTAKALDRSYKTLEALAPEASPEALLKAARWPEGSEPVLIIGHQPTLGLLAAQLLAGVEQPWPIRKGAVWWLRSRDREGSAQVVLHAVIAPDSL